MKKLLIHLPMIAVLLLSNMAFSQFQTQTHSVGQIPLGGNTSADECSASLMFAIPPGSTVDSIRVWYDVIATGGGYRSDARTLISCTEGSSEATYTPGGLTGTGVEFYNRSISSLYSGVTATGVLNFTLFAWDSYNAAASCGGGNELYIDNSTWVITVFYTAPPMPFSYSSSTTTQNNTTNLMYCTSDQEIIGIEVVTGGNTGTFNLTELQINMNGTTNLADATNIDIFYTGSSAIYSPIGLFGSSASAGGTITIPGSQTLVAGTNYFWIAYDMVGAIFTGGNSMDAECTQITVGGSNYVPSQTDPGVGRTTESCQTTPGSVSSGLKMWLKANGTPTADGSLTSTWMDDSGNSNDAAQGNAAKQPYFRDNPTNNLNFNPIIDFIRDDPTPVNNDRLDFNTPTNGTQNVILVFNTTQINTTSSWHYDYPLLYGGDVNPGVVSGESDFAIGMGDWFGTGDKLSFGGGGNADWKHSSGTVISTGLPVILTVDKTDVTNGNMQLNWRNNGLASGSHNEVLAFCADPMPSLSSLGSHLTTEASAYDGGVSEVIVYDNVLSYADKNKIESYLAIKYGVTLDQSSPQDYVLGDGTVVWDASIVPVIYNNDIAGISREDISSQHQKQSKSVNLGSLVTIGLGPIAITNSANLASFSSDGLTLVWSNDNAALSWVLPETPPGLALKLQREWYSEENNGDVGTVTIEVNDADLPATGGNIVHLLIDADGDFSTGAIIIPMTLSAGVWTVTANFTDDYYFSFGINVTPLPIELIEFNATPVFDKVKLDWITATELNNDYFTVEKSRDGIAWEEVLKQDGAGVSTAIQQYSGQDNSPHPNLSYYRLKQTDYDGMSTYSDIRVVDFKISNIVLYPSPANSFIVLDGVMNKDEYIQISDMTGKNVTEQMAVLERQQMRVVLDVSQLASGVYFVRTKGETLKFIVR